MDRYIFFDPSRVPPGLHVLGIPTPRGLVWLEVTEAEYHAAVEDLDAARRLVAYAAQVIAARLVGAGELRCASGE